MPDYRDWRSLLRELNRRAGQAFKEDDITNADAFRLELIAQSVGDRLGDRFEAVLRDSVRGDRAGQYSTRLELLRKIPFRAVVTTNFDNDLEGSAPDAHRMVTSLRTARPVWTRIGADNGMPRGTVVKLHGQIGASDNEVVLSRRAYRSRVHGKGGYSRLVSAAFAMNDVLFLGTSFTDAYLNELRSEVLSWFEQTGRSVDPDACLACQMPVRWWAIIPDAAPEMIRSMARHDGIEVVTYDARSGTDHSAFDAILKDLSDKASLVGLLRERVGHASKLRARPAQVWWCDDAPNNNDLGAKLLREALGWDGVCQFSSTKDLETALDREVPPMLIITKFGGDEGKFVFPVLDAARSTSTPVVAFGWPHDVDGRRWRARAHGAVDYTHDWRDLFRVIAELFESEAERNRRLFGGDPVRGRGAPSVLE